MRQHSHDSHASTAMLENLENRRLFAGNVTAALNGAGELVINGDNKSNDVQVVIDFSTHVVPVAGTTVNGGTTPVDFGGAPDIVITTGNGNDDVDVVDPFEQSISISTGNGEDEVVVRPSAFIDSNVDNLTIDTGNGDDVVIVALNGIFTEVSGNLTIRTGNGSDFVRLAGDVDVLGNVLIDGGHGGDTLDDTGLGTVGGTTTVLGIETFI